jgi:cysteine desulfurase / selenocysteine lyase
MLQQPAAPLSDQTRHTLFPVTRRGIFLAHAAVTALPRVAVEKIQEALHSGMNEQQENEKVFRQVEETRAIAARLINASEQEIALLGPTALGLNLVANGLAWNPGDEVVYYQDCYPANVYPWQNLAVRGVVPVALRPGNTGELTPELVFAALTPRTKLVALASCHFITGYRLDYQTIGAELKRRGILFCLDGIQSVGATPLDANYFDFLSADSHKWLLGPLGAGFFYVKESLFETLKPTLLGSWNILSPQFIAQPQIEYFPTARRYECGSLFLHGIIGMRASMELLLEVGLPAISARLLHLHHYLAEKLRPLGFDVLSDHFPENAKSGILTVTKSSADLPALFHYLSTHRVHLSQRWSREGLPFLRFAPHFYNTEEELDEVARLLK